MRYGKTKITAIFLLLIYTFISLSAISVAASFETADTAEYALASVTNQDGDIKISSRLLELIGGKENKSSKMLAVGGTVFGLRIKEKGVLVTEREERSEFMAHDRIISVNGTRVSSPEEIEKLVKESHGAALDFEILRSGELIYKKIVPYLQGSEYKLGVKLRSRATGIGTVTFIDPETKLFAGLGHGVCDAGGELLPIESGVSTDVILTGVKKGEAGKPGELNGSLTKRQTGVILKNSECGIFGILDEVDSESLVMMPVAERGEIVTGEAEIISSVKNGRATRYKIEITEIDYSSEGAKSFKVRVTDDVLKSITGGIVRGMSGSPVIQNGKIVGALTHVMVSDSECGYGIFIENMLAEMMAR